MKRIIMSLLAIILAFSMMACPSKVNRPPKIVKIEGDQMIDINMVIYNHVRGDDFHPDDIIEDLVNNQNIMAVDYNQSGVSLGRSNKFYNISNRLIITSFYEIWVEGDDANFDGEINEADEEFYGDIKTDEDGNYIYDDMKIFLVQILGVGQELEFTMMVSDDDGATAQISGKIVIVEE